MKGGKSVTPLELAQIKSVAVETSRLRSMTLPATGQKGQNLTGQRT